MKHSKKDLSKKNKWRKLPLKGWERRHIFKQFKACEFPFLVVGSNLHLNQSIHYLKTHRWSVYLGCVYVVTRAANEIAAFRQRIRGNDAIEHEIVHADFTVPQGAESFSFKRVPFDLNFQIFHKNALNAPCVDIIPPSQVSADDHWVFMSCIPWISFTHVVQPLMSLTKDSIPRVLWGKIEPTTNGQHQMPITIQVHHALVDALHIAKFQKKVEELFSTPQKTFGE